MATGAGAGAGAGAPCTGATEVWTAGADAAALPDSRGGTLASAGSTTTIRLVTTILRTTILRGGAWGRPSPGPPRSAGSCPCAIRVPRDPATIANSSAVIGVDGERGAALGSLHLGATVSHRRRRRRRGRRPRRHTISCPSSSVVAHAFVGPVVVLLVLAADRRHSAPLVLVCTGGGRGDGAEATSAPPGRAVRGRGRRPPGGRLGLLAPHDLHGPVFHDGADLTGAACLTGVVAVAEGCA